MKLALVYDRINKWGGAERLLTHLHALWPQAPVYTGVYHPSTAPWAKTWDIRPTFVNRFPAASANHEWYFWLMPLALETLDLSGSDVVLSVCSDFTKGVITRPEQLHISYIFSPTRYLWLTPNEYRDWSGGVLRPLLAPLLSHLRHWDYLAAQRPDVIITISQAARRQILKYYHRDATVIYPPVDTDFFKPPDNWKLPARPSGGTTDNYFLVVSRLVPHKNLELAITACNQLKLPLKIIGTGRQEAALRRLAGPTVEFLGQVSDSQLLQHYRHCQALILPGEEAFGLTMAEAQACGKPVIALNRGSAPEIILPDQTGLLFDQPTPSSLIRSLKSFTRLKFDPRRCRDNALRFSLDNFHRRMRQYVHRAWAGHQRQL